MKILVAYDGTLSSKDTLRYSIRRAEQTRAELVVLSVFNPDPFIDYDGWGAEEKARKEAARALAEAKVMIRQASGNAPISLYSAEGSVERVVTEFARAEHIDLILSPARYADMAEGASCRVSLLPRECAAC
ncbi:MAG TPA: universal stress protein [Dissulfurispiraceae bacterium]|nr:universal stress protein [Dissulfurispiraceae bacterium]